MNNETFSDFKNSFSYGSRTDLNFKFLKGLSDEAAADFFQQLLWKLGDTLNDGDVQRLIDHVVAGQTASYSAATTWTYDEGSLTPLPKPLAEMHIGVLTSTGHFVAGQDPQPLGVENMSQQEAIDRIQDFLKAAPDLSEIPLDTPREALRVRHGGYDIRGVQADPNVALPLDHIKALVSEGVIGSAEKTAFSFVGAAAQRRLLSKSGPAWLAEFQSRSIEGMLLVPV